MTVRIYRSTDASAPTLTGSAGTLLAVLDAALVNGYGSQTAAGWTIAYTGTNKRQYAMASGGTSCQLYVDDSGPGAGGAREARITGFKTGTGLGTGTGQFPTTAQMTAPSGALVVRKSTTADATARAWTIIADGHTIYAFMESGDNTSPVSAYAWMFGDFFSYSSSDTNNCMIIGRTIENSSAMGTGSASSVSTTASTSIYDAFSLLSCMNTSGLSNAISGHYACANYTGTGGSLPVGKHSDHAKMGVGGTASLVPQLGWQGSGFQLGVTTLSNAGSVSQFPYPNAADSGLYAAPVWIHHGGLVRGYLKGLWCPLQHLPLGHNDTYSGTGNLSGKSMIAQSIAGIGSWGSSTAVVSPAQVHIEYSDTWS